MRREEFILSNVFLYCFLFGLQQIGTRRAPISTELQAGVGRQPRPFPNYRCDNQPRPYFSKKVGQIQLRTHD